MKRNVYATLSQECLMKLRHYVTLLTGMYISGEQEHILLNKLHLLSIQNGFASVEEYLAYLFSEDAIANCNTSIALREDIVGIYGDTHVNQDQARYRYLLQEFIHTITVHDTRFFRHEEQIILLQKEIFPKIIHTVESNNTDRMLTMLSIGCSSGEEVYTTAMVLAAILGIQHYKWRIKILGIDISHNSLALARTALYTEKQVEHIPKGLRHFCIKTNGGYRMADVIRDMVDFQYYNLYSLDKDECSSIFGEAMYDCIFCRNVLIYFYPNFAKEVLLRIHTALKKTGYVCFGPGEVVMLQSTASNVYERYAGMIYIPRKSKS